jgi:RNA polymerase sigma factor (sigma-70 family)
MAYLAGSFAFRAYLHALQGWGPSVLKISEQAERSFGVLLEDAERVGPLSRAHVISVAERRGLDADETATLLVLLQQAEALETSVQPTIAGAEPDSGGKYMLWKSGLSPHHEMPGRLRDHPIMRPEQEVELGQQIQMGLKAKDSISRGEAGDELVSLAEGGDAARRTMIVNNVRLVHDVAKGFIALSGDLEFDDLVQEGVRGLNRAAEKFDPALGYKFSTYATWWIRQAISRAIADTSTTVRLPVHVWEFWRQIVRYRRDFEIRNNRLPTLQEIAEALGKDPGTVMAIIDFASPLVRLDAPISEDEGGGTLSSMLLPATPSIEDEVLDKALIQEVEKRMEVLAADYDWRALRVMEGRFGLHGHEQMTLEELGREFGVTRERVRQIEKKVRMMIQADPVLISLAPEHRKDIHGAA